MRNRLKPAFAAAFAAFSVSSPITALGQTVPESPTKADKDNQEETIVLSPFEVKSEASTGYAATSTLAGNRLATELRDIGNAVQVVTSEFLKDIGATDNQTLLQYTTNTEVGGFFGNFAGYGDSSHLDESSRFVRPNFNTRVRGLTSADNTRDFFLTDVPWDGYNIEAVDLQRGPNSILFGQGSPAGIINARTKQASFKDSNEISFRVGSWGSTRETVDFNKVLLRNELAIRVAAVRDDENYKQDPAYSTQKRIYGAMRYEPRFLKTDSIRTIIKANVEFGDIDSNNPRQLPPNDRITPWFATGNYEGHNVQNDPFSFPNLNHLTVNPKQNEDDNTGLPNHGYNRPSHNGPGGVYTGLFIPQYASLNATGKFGGTPNEYYQPWVSGSMLGVFGSPLYNFQYNNAAQGIGINWEPTSNHGMDATGSNGTRSNGILPYIRPGSVASYSEFARNARLYYKGLPAWSYGVYKDKSLTDASVFDFYNQLLDGPTKHEFQNFRTYNASFAQTFFHDLIGYEATYNREWYKSGKVQLITDDSINIDFNRVYSDGTPAGKDGLSWEDGTPNPNLGKAYVGGGGGQNNVTTSNRESGRLTVFADYDFNKNRQNWITKLIGRHVLTGLLNGDRQEIDDRSFQRYSVNDPAWEKVINGSPTDSPKISFTDGRMNPYTFIYLGNSLLSANSASGAHLPNPQVNPKIISGQVMNFDATWKPSTDPSNPSYVNPAAFWHNDYNPYQNPIAIDGFYRDANGNILPYTDPVTGAVTNPPGYSTQSENPANYVGFRPYPINYIDSLDSEANRDLNTTSARLTKSKVFSRALNWQGRFWDNTIVATYGVRKDIATAWQYSLNTGSPSSLNANNFRLNLDPSNYHLAEAASNRLEVLSHAWSVVGHLNQLPFLDRLPILVSLSYNHSTDFQPAAQRVDIYGEPLSAPSGVTRDTGILLETKDGRYSLKINKYQTDTVNSDSAGLSGAWFIGSSQAWAANWVNRFEFNWTGDTVADAVGTNDPTNTQYNYEPAPGESLADAQAREASVIAAWRAWQKSVDPRFYKAWGINLNDHTRSVSANVPNGFAVTEDSTSKGYEFEFNALPLKNWRITINASKTTAQRKNIGGENLAAFIDAYTKALGTGAKGSVGDLRIWWGGAGNETVLQEWNGNIGSEYNQRKLQEGTNVPELRKWRVNAITNYEFDRSWMKGINVGGGVRYESSVGIGYEPIAGETANDITFDISDPYRGPSEINFDLWAGYTRRVWRNVTWNVQFNVRNVGVGNELVPITTEPDGSGATYRIRPPQSFTLTNTFTF
ncbi:MAG TPA: TonB-dependent receptor plug domain-containing protein [Opitutaceae bacterium]|nr:TonB-dependent receptor plug domain-containing protein [Opitutaceae bacterium]